MEGSKEILPVAGAAREDALRDAHPVLPVPMRLSPDGCDMCAETEARQPRNGARSRGTELAPIRAEAGPHNGTHSACECLQSLTDGWGEWPGDSG